MREYFYGKKGPNSFFPFSFDVRFSDIELYKIGGVCVCVCVVRACVLNLNIDLTIILSVESFNTTLP